MIDMMVYKGYIGSVHYSDEEEVFFGKVEYIKSLINYKATDVKTLKAAFKSAVEDYLESCSELNINPEKPFKGSLNVRIGEEVHRQAAIYAEQNNLSLNQLVKDALSSYIR
ncbi:MAG: HicB family protein [Rickettsiaceae bacterium]|jgi:predicted HicB family RNase H-like nuclease|nr:HicB family protein [Rickettsiaceae bacterium]